MTQHLDFHRESDPKENHDRNCNVFYDLASEVTFSTLFNTYLLKRSALHKIGTTEGYKYQEERIIGGFLGC